MSNDLEKFLIKEIKKSSYPLEIEVSSILEENEWIVINNEYYVDRNTNKEREIDIVAFEHILKSEGSFTRLHAKLNIVIECKKSNTHAWVFFSRTKRIQMWPSGHYIDSVQVKTNYKGSLIEYIKNFHYFEFKKVASTYAEYKIQKLEKIKKNKSQKEEIFTAVNQLINYIIYAKEEILINDKDSQKNVSFLIYFPIIVFDGKLYKCTIKGEEPKLKETNHVLLKCRHPEGIFYIDVVKREYFEEFLLEIINNDKKRIFEGIDENYLQIIEIAESRTRKDDVAIFGPKK